MAVETDTVIHETIRLERQLDHPPAAVFTERLVHGDQLLAMSLVTWALTPSGPGTTLVVTDQVTSLAGQGPIDGSREGYAAILDRLANHLASQRPD